MPFLNETHRTMVDAVCRKAEQVCPGALAAVGVYGSALSGDTHPRSDLDLLILINDPSGYELADCFVLDDTGVGYDLYCTTWEMLEADAKCPHAHLGKLMDAEPVYVSDVSVTERLTRLRVQADGVLRSEKRFDSVRALLSEAKWLYADALLSDDLGQVRLSAACLVDCLTSAVMLRNGRYFRRGVKRLFEELSAVRTPESFEQNLRKIPVLSETAALKGLLTDLLRSTLRFCVEPVLREPPSPENLSGVYEELTSNWRGKMGESAERGDVFTSFACLASAANMYAEVAAEVELPECCPLADFSPSCLSRNVDAFDRMLDAVRGAYTSAGFEPRRYADVREFAIRYLGNGC